MKCDTCMQWDIIWNEIKYWHMLHINVWLKHCAKKPETSPTHIHIRWFYLCEMSKIGKSTETENRLMFALGWKEREMGNDS